MNKEIIAGRSASSGAYLRSEIAKSAAVVLKTGELFIPFWKSASSKAVSLSAAGDWWDRELRITAGASFHVSGGGFLNSVVLSFLGRWIRTGAPPRTWLIPPCLDAVHRWSSGSDSGTRLDRQECSDAVL